MFSDFTMEMTIDLVTGGNGQDQIGEDKGIRPSIQEFAVAFSEAQVSSLLFFDVLLSN